MHVLIVEDDAAAVRFLAQALLEAGYGVESAPDGLSGLARGRAGRFDLILLDVMLPGMDGFELCRRLRESGVTTPILLLTARDAVEDIVAGLDGGADDYLVKPFRIAELLARARAAMRRVEPAAEELLRVADLTLDPVSHAASRAGREIALSATESALLEILMRHKGRVVTRTRILRHVWQYEFGGNANVLDVYIGYLRRKVDRGFSPPLIHTIRGVGFRMGVFDAT
ncbi:MAG TPA: response regulator transcription factor [Chthonomonadaceae bacterium]|nr:response regulator transcription factor [Chthonomonadaceae bacterium]